jgi:hypothetical protein
MKIVVILVFAVIFGSGAVAQEAPKQEQKSAIDGIWEFEVHHPAGVSKPTVTIGEKEGKLSGKYVGSYGESPLTGSIKGAEFTFSVEVGNEQKVTVVYTGTVEKDAVKGSVSLGELGEGTFTGKRK